VIALFTVLTLFTSQPNPSYDFPVGSETKFNVKVQFDGYLPLFGGKVGKADVDMIVRALGVESKKSDLQSVDSEITELKAVAFGSTLPLNKNNIGQFFPRAIAVIEMNGEVKKNDAPEVNMPVKLPGLDSRRLPEISYVPLVIDAAAAASGKSYEFKRTFNGSVMTYKVTPGKMDESKEDFTIEINQESESFEDAYGNPLIGEAVRSVAKSYLKTILTGKGTATFNFAKRMFDKVVVETTGDTVVTNIKTGKTSKRSLKTTLTIVRDGAKIDQ
jgi:hypothetical protein